MDVFSLLIRIGLPGYIAAAGILFYIFVITFRPITLLSANIFEKKLFSKERLFLLMSWSYLWQTAFWTSVFFSMVILTGVPKWTADMNISSLVSTIAVFFGELLFLLIVLVNNKVDSRFLNFFETDWGRRILAVTFVICLSIFYFAFNGLIVGSIQGENQVDKLTAILVLSFVFSLPIPAIMKPVSKLIEWSKEKHILIKEEPEQESHYNTPTSEESYDNGDWYVLHAINKELILLGNKPNPKLCTETKIIKIEELCDKKMFIE
ncbi:hypothetical protein BTA31_20905 [Bacillus haynesii]|uniref:Uncharacterized protein n=1 Tax=Bacillus haynesii TaxID=1925021 RepID=A0ABX3HY13_9BACI|nr:hypothetical protein [Bacillus haynesii]OMI24863.1 hypothetical protein BTA31_20905 [Bacillus haynesii]